MRRLKSSLPAKIIAFCLLLACMVVFFVGTLGILFLTANDAYLDGGHQLRAKTLNQLFYQDKDAISSYLYARLAENDSLWEKQHFMEQYDPEHSNLFFTITDEQGKVLFSNYEEQQWQAEYDFSEVLEVPVDQREVSGEFVSYEEAESFVNDVMNTGAIMLYSDIFLMQDGSWCATVTYQETEVYQVEVKAYVRENLTAKDRYYHGMLWLDRLIGARYGLIVMEVLVTLIGGCCFVFLLYAAGHKKGVEGIHFNWIDRIPLDLYLGMVFLFVWFSLLILMDLYDDFAIIVCGLLALSVGILLLLSLILTVTTRLKADRWWCNTLLYRLLRLLKRGIRALIRGLAQLPLYWQGAAIWIGLSIGEFWVLTLCYDIYDYYLFWLLEKLLLTPLLIYLMLTMRRLQRGGKELADGNITYQVDTHTMIGSFRTHGEHLNGIGDGLQTALEKQIRSERLKAELITNVSHDIKTPLTSIVNYVDLLKKEGLDSENAATYLAVLDRQSARLKKLTEDLIEASKASTGNMTVHAEPTDVNVLLTQAGGEYEQKLEKAGLKLLWHLAPELPMVQADGRLLWRVFDNLLQNICKYAQAGTRVYLTSSVQKEQVEILFRNISRDPLHISSEELMDRFVRGDASRNTEGSGLGLSIAKSLTELQGGRFEIQIDGDLFKAKITLPALPTQEQPQDESIE